jgi:hypothetical protein
LFGVQVFEHAFEEYRVDPPPEEGGSPVRWSEFERVAPELADAGRGLFSQFGVGLAYLATIRSDGGPRLHPMCPLLAEDGLYGFLIPSPKARDLVRDGRYAMHAFAPEEVDDEFCITGTARAVDAGPLRDTLAATHTAAVEDDHRLFEFDVETALLARYRHRGDWPPTYTVWRERDSA